MRTGLVGCGVVGRVLGTRLLRAGHGLTVHDMDESRAATLLEAGAQWATSPGDLARRCELIVSSLPGPDEARAVATAGDGIWSGASPGTLHVETSTVGPDCVRDLARAAASQRVRFLEAAISSGGAEETGYRLVMWVGGNVDYFDLARPVLDVLADEIAYCGRMGNAQIAKLVNNHVAFSLAVVLGEALTLGVRAGVPLEVLRIVLRQGTAQSRMLDEMLPASVFRDNWEPGLRLDLARKDLALVAKLAQDTGIELPVADLVAGSYRRASDHGWDSRSAHSVIRLAEEATGVELRIGSASGPAREKTE
jgi:3-hydroxyisobutyrate dehydrogenase-like beta-hydroxyacid dehydrogenase